MVKSYLRMVKNAVSKVKSSKLKGLNGKETKEKLDELKDALGLKSRAEAVAFAALFDRSCSGRSSDMSDLAHYFDCSDVEVYELKSAVEALKERNLIIQTNPGDPRLVHRDYMVTNYVMECVTENRKPDVDEAQHVEHTFNRYDFCSLVGKMVEDLSVTCEELFLMVTAVEDEYGSMTFIKHCRMQIPEVRHRVLFYDICCDYLGNCKTLDISCTDKQSFSDVDATLDDIYNGSKGMAIKEKCELLNEKHLLLRLNLIELSDNKNRMGLTDVGKKLLLEDDFNIFCKEYNELDRYQFADVIASFVHNQDEDANASRMRRITKEILKIEQNNPQFGFVGKLQGAKVLERALFYILCDSCVKEARGINVVKELSALFTIKDRKAALFSLKAEKHILQELGLAELNKMAGIFGETQVLSLTDKGKELFFEEDASFYMSEVSTKNSIQACSITEKNLFFSDELQSQLQRVENAMQEENYINIVSRLEEKGMPKGMAVLLYGSPGTGKTETALQWARKCGRDILPVDISEAKSMWYGESQKQVKKIFKDYKTLCQRSEKKPILLFNEADALFSTRLSLNGRGDGSSVQQTENAIQNIILEEMENMDGIIIATTNLEGNLDGAFERRFLYKIRYDKPGTAAKQRIWSDKMPALSEEDVKRLADEFDFSGGEIDNIVRKATMDEVITGQTPDINILRTLCKEERIANTSNAKIGFLN